MSSITACSGFSALQRAEIAEILLDEPAPVFRLKGFSALQRAEIAEMLFGERRGSRRSTVSVLFNEPKLLKFYDVLIVSVTL